MFLKNISMTNVLSFGDKTTQIELNPLNILIGHNGSGKSNLIECIGLLQAAPTNLATAILKGGGISDWLWKGRSINTNGSIEIIATYPQENKDLLYRIGFTDVGLHFEVIDERIEDKYPRIGQELRDSYFLNLHGHAFLTSKNNEDGAFPASQFSPSSSILSQIKDPIDHPEITWLGESFRKIYIYQDWSFGRNSPYHLPQKANVPTDFLTENLENLGIILNNLKQFPSTRNSILNNLKLLYPSADDYGVIIQGNYVQIVIHEENFVIPANRLSDGTLRFLCLLAILCHPSPPPLICIEEPELGLHPDMMPVIADLLRDAATRTQLIVTTHSDLLVEEFTDEPECVLTFEKQGDQTVVHRLDSGELAHWLEKYTLGQLRQKGHIAGNRW
jgi:predicted ATPase